uniref:Retrovirus-related Pol polyprotein from transposon TNT 1-94 n=1 Tax=Cajanus cajan TaxID=3821 RepID=A0A151SVY3_CAJCA|nr:hypothetical protein KK1_014384 [Cajanus cajan]
MFSCKPIETPIDKDLYQRLAGRLIYLSHTRSNITYVVSIVSQFMHSPNEKHMNIVVYRRSTLAYFTFVEGNFVTWRSKKQKVVVRSNAKVEFCGIAHGV